MATLRRVVWDAALDKVAGGLRAIIDEHGPDAVALYVSGQLLTEDYYVANKLMKGYVGSANIDTNSRLCMSSAVAGHKRAFGEDVVPGCYEDLELADLVVLVGSNTAWCHPILFQRIAAHSEAPAGAEARGDRSAPHRHLRAGRPAPAAQAGHRCVAVQRPAVLLAQRRRDRHRLRHAAHAGPGRRRWRRPHVDCATRCRWRKSAASTRKRCSAFYRHVRRHAQVVTAFSQGVNQSSRGTDKVNSIINCHLLDRAHRPAGHGAVLDDRPAQRHGRARSGRPGQHAGRAHGPGQSARTARPCRPSGSRPRIAAKPGLKAVDLFEAHRGGQSQGRVDHRHQSAGQPARRRPGARARWSTASWWWCPTQRAAPTPTPIAARAAARAGLGREGRHGDQLRAPHLAPARVSAGAGRSARRLVDTLRRGAAHGLRRLRLHLAARDFRRTCAPVRLPQRRRTGAPVQSGAAWRRSMPAQYDALAPQQWPQGQARLFGDGRFAHADGRARFVPPRRARRATCRDEDIRWCSTRAACATSGTP